MTGFANPSVRKRLERTTRRSTFRAVQLYAEGIGRRGILTNPEVQGLRRLLEFQLARPAMRPDPATVVTPVKVRHADGQVRGEWVERPAADGSRRSPGVVSTRDDTVLLYVHGGGFVAGSPRSHRGLTSELSRRLGLSVFSVDYRLAPEYRFPAAADDVLRAYRWLLDRGVPASRVVIAGDSAGGHLSLGLTPRAVRAGLPAPAGVLAFSPVVDVSMELGAAREQASRRGGGRSIEASAGRAAIRRYHPGVPSSHPELTLTNDDLSVLPPVLVQASSTEILAADAEAYVAALEAAGGQARLRMWARQMHVFQVAFRISPVAREALDDVEVFVREVMGAAAS